PTGLAGHVLLERHQEDGCHDEKGRPDRRDRRESLLAENAAADSLENQGEDTTDQPARHHRGGSGGAQTASGAYGEGFGHRAPAPVRTVQMLFQRIWRSRAGDMCWM